ncbi:hypothetical protein NPX13_g11226 [Xylaria arbuscula]|uniref:Serine aminopeptidase S33 domain-containing protein n=1 Tax=Xylaria arbuscula TaxID=114810 RepID=A0A9W8TG19_9PEZI|nr:hypothetical protein NPX13_g11226 [Xylaria arbuscula]
MAIDTNTSVEFKTIDGTIISAWQFLAKDVPAPTIIMSHGFNCVKEMALPEVAEGLHALGYNVFLYDARSVGASGGKPRNLLNPLQMAEDLSDIYTQVSKLPSVDAAQIVLWGLSFGAVISACTAAVDYRPKAIVMVCPLFSFVQLERRTSAFAQVIRDRASQLRGNSPHEIPPFTPRGDNPIGMAGSGSRGGIESYAFMRLAKEKGAAGFRDQISLQTYYKLALFRPAEYMDMIRSPVLMVVPELDLMSSPAEQEAAFRRVQAPGSELWVAKGRGHLNVVTGEGCFEVVKQTDKFIRGIMRV